MSEAFEHGVKTAFVSWMSSRAARRALVDNSDLISDVVDSTVQKAFSSDNARQLVANTLKKGALPLAAGALGVGAMAGAGAAMGTYIASRFISQNAGPPPRVYDPSIYYSRQDAHQSPDLNRHSAPSMGVK